ncbi:MAG: response regulator [Pseudolabrys sp.]|nr:response regulator [Pseudolabrys sp.]
MQLSISHRDPVSRAQRNDENVVRLSSIVKRRVLLVEDEVLVGMMMRDILEENGLSVVGPCVSVADAVTALGSGDLSCAILDLNLGGQATYEIARSLVDRGVPYAFVTGYGRESIDAVYRDAPILQKPVVREELIAFLRNALGSVATAAAVDISIQSHADV